MEGSPQSSRIHTNADGKGDRKVRKFPVTPDIYFFRFQESIMKNRR